MPLRITSWNVNGIRNPFGYEPWRANRTYQAMFDTLEADIVVMQEAKIQRKDLQDDMVLVPGWDVYFSLPKHKKGYSGVAIYTRSSKCAPIRAEEGITGVLCPPNSATSFRDLPEDQRIGGYPRPGQLSSEVDEATLDSEGRAVILEFPAFVLIGVYSPATRDESRDEFRQAYIDAMDVRVRNLVAMGKQVILTGDLNIIRSELDTAGLAERLRKEELSLDDFFSSPSRRFLNQIVFGGRVLGERDEGREEPVLWDLCREFHPTRTGMYTCWETKKNCRPGNFGSRIDYVLCSSGIKDWFIDSNIQEGLLGSDHCPVYATMSDTVNHNRTITPLTDLMNPEGMFSKGERQREWTIKDALPTSAKLIPEFKNRRSIKDMFFKKPTTAAKPTIATATTSSQALPPLPTTNPAVPEQDPSTQNDPVFLQPSSQTTAPPSSNSTLDASPQKPPPKRPAAASLGTRPQKKGKVTLAKETSKTGASASQGTLKGFFKPKTPIPSPSQEPAGTSNTSSTPPANSSASTLLPAESAPETHSPSPPLNENTGSSLMESPLTTIPSDEKVFDPIENKASWSKLLGKRVVPKCEHGEDCISRTTKKPGVNCGRSFFMCGRPTGPSGKKEDGTTEFCCRTFIWSSEWKPGSSVSSG
ncbi:Endonuclease/exonuclease/phosphatase [Apiosordaria backusii]|uniref:DNA-(apurinic or apyrimidinic site) endonuclease 2 n=1 Tax=Apiosordaria backusii TaxID=314023 RepID=A0AA40AXC1_9PEZI|nr:Endonuclease/exonuclease/phosphatase [Apiosordaria backusii]